MFKLNRLVSCGIITNYDCSSKCKHCAYSSSSSWPKDHMQADMAHKIFSFLKKHGCDSVHIGGGEPLLRPQQLFPVLEAAAGHGITIEYIETNASWHMDLERSGALIEKLKDLGVYTLLISIDPFHNEYIPFSKVKGLMEACRRYGMDVFPWKMDFWKDLDAFQDDRPHSLEEYEKHFGPDYKLRLIQRYQLGLKGRSLENFKEYARFAPLGDILDSSTPCRELRGVYHFHIDLYGNFIPQSCPGISVNIADLSEGAAPEKYPIINALDSLGVKGLYDLATGRYGYTPRESYAGKCDLCHDIRRFLVTELKLGLPDLKPEGYYTFMYADARLKSL